MQDVNVCSFGETQEHVHDSDKQGVIIGDNLGFETTTNKSPQLRDSCSGSTRMRIRWTQWLPSRKVQSCCSKIGVIVTAFSDAHTINHLFNPCIMTRLRPSYICTSTARENTLSPTFVYGYSWQVQQIRLNIKKNRNSIKLSIPSLTCISLPPSIPHPLAPRAGPQSTRDSWYIKVIYSSVARSKQFPLCWS